jgi:hypothetical protein
LVVYIKERGAMKIKCSVSPGQLKAITDDLAYAKSMNRESPIQPPTYLFLNQVVDTVKARIKRVHGESLSMAEAVHISLTTFEGGKKHE